MLVRQWIDQGFDRLLQQRFDECLAHMFFSRARVARMAPQSECRCLREGRRMIPGRLPPVDHALPGDSRGLSLPLNPVDPLQVLSSPSQPCRIRWQRCPAGRHLVAECPHARWLAEPAPCPGLSRERPAHEPLEEGEAGLSCAIHGVRFERFAEYMVHRREAHPHPEQAPA